MENPDRPEMRPKEADQPPPRVFVRGSLPEWLESIPKGSKLVSITFPDHPELNVPPEERRDPIPPKRRRER